MCLFSIFVCFVFDIKIKIKINKKNFKNQKNIKTVCVLCTLVLVYLGWPLKQSFLNFVSFVAIISRMESLITRWVRDEKSAAEKSENMRTKSRLTHAKL